MPKVPYPRPTLDAVSRGARWAAFDAEAQGAPVEPLKRVEADALRRREPALSPWRVVAAQAAVGLVLAALGGCFGGEANIGVSALYGAAVVVVPGALMARGMTSPLSSTSPLVSTLSVFTWGFVKMGASVGMLAAATRVVPHLSWPALLAAMVICMQTYWFALLWRGRSEN